MKKERSVTVKGAVISVVEVREQDFISLTDIARHKNPEEPKDVVKNWMRSKATIEFLGIWEKLHNPGFKGVEFDSFMYQAGSNAFVLSPTKWIDKTGAKGISVKQGKTGGTFAHKDIAFEFASWVSAEFKLYLLLEFQRLKDDENGRLKLGWTLQRELAKVNYRIHTDAIKDALIPKEVGSKQASIVYADEADMLNMALFGMTAAKWRENNPGKQGNIRDNARLEQLVVLSNLESINSMLIRHGVSQGERLIKLNEMAIVQMKSLLKNDGLKRLK